MATTALKDYLEPYPGIRDFIFTPPSEGRSRTWIFAADEPPQTILNFHFSFLLTHGWQIVQNEPTLIAKRADADLSVSSWTTDDSTRVAYEVRT